MIPLVIISQQAGGLTLDGLVTVGVVEAADADGLPWLGRRWLGFFGVPSAAAAAIAGARALAVLRLPGVPLLLGWPLLPHGGYLRPRSGNGGHGCRRRRLPLQLFLAQSVTKSALDLERLWNLTGPLILQVEILVCKACKEHAHCIALLFRQNRLQGQRRLMLSWLFITKYCRGKSRQGEKSVSK